MKLVGVYSSSHETFKDEWFLRTLKDDYEVCLYPSEARGHGNYMEADWQQAVRFKSAKIIETIQKNWGEVFVYSDMDVLFVGPTKTTIQSCLNGKDIVCQLDDPGGNLCTGFFGASIPRSEPYLHSGEPGHVPRQLYHRCGAKNRPA